MMAVGRRALGSTGAVLPEVALGTWQFSGAYGAIGAKEVRSTVRRALDLGISCFDTAPAYGTEEILADGLAGVGRDDYFLVTKCGLRVEGGEEVRNSSKDAIMADVEGSLVRLHTDHVDLLLVHWPDPRTPIDETVCAVNEVVKRGHARFAGLSNFRADDVRAVQTRRRVDAIEVGYHLFDRRPEEALLPYAGANDIGVIGYSTLAGGLLSGQDAVARRVRSPLTGQPIFRADNLDRNLKVVAALRELAVEGGLTVAQLAVAWVLQNPVVSTALIGARTPQEVEGIAGASAVRLTNSTLTAIDTIMKAAAGRVRSFTPERRGDTEWEDPIEPGNGVELSTLL